RRRQRLAGRRTPHRAGPLRPRQYRRAGRLGARVGARRATGRAPRRRYHTFRRTAGRVARDVDGVYRWRADSRRRLRARAARQPSSSAAVTTEATTTKVTATPPELALRNSIPTTTVHTHTATPVGAIANGRRQPRLTTHPTAAPTRNGHAMSATPTTVTPSL